MQKAHVGAVCSTLYLPYSVKKLQHFDTIVCIKCIKKVLFNQISDKSIPFSKYVKLLNECQTAWIELRCRFAFLQVKISI